jgi:hypothetical protein
VASPVKSAMMMIRRSLQRHRNDFDGSQFSCGADFSPAVTIAQRALRYCRDSQRRQCRRAPVRARSDRPESRGPADGGLETILDELAAKRIVNVYWPERAGER